MHDPIKKSLVVPLSPDEAFTLFTANMDTWWPTKTFSVFGEKAKIAFPDHKGGDIIETGENGEVDVWGTLIAYDPGVFLSFTWHPGRPASEATVVTVTFTQTEDGTRCDLTHGGFDILGDTADAVSTSYLTGWDMVLGCYASAVKITTLA
ncbi:SRPBCC family protein [Yoonia sp. F2084L]|uniref:SRPBCC family protein n=1 Tax=Yoonia sp. F2084L TaxID=2926419 RepID=UPI001FF642D2|nr:SRPBCC family protein [Yoonia sp. F2084L]MCK0097583.1 SRPBCC family protein [Yoonia sp. F2084L]